VKETFAISSSVCFWRRWLNTRCLGLYRALPALDLKFIDRGAWSPAFTSRNCQGVPETCGILNGGDQGSRVPDSMGVALNTKFAETATRKLTGPNSTIWPFVISRSWLYTMFLQIQITPDCSYITLSPPLISHSHYACASDTTPRPRCGQDSRTCVSPLLLTLSLPSTHNSSIGTSWPIHSSPTRKWTSK
jgi:hypothetical protein